MPKKIEAPADEPSAHDAGDTGSTQPSANEPTPAQRSSAEPAQPSAKGAEPREPAAPRGDNLDGLLSEYERTVRQPAPAQQHSAQPPQYDPEDLERVLAEHERITQPREREQRINEILLGAALDLDQKRTAIIRQQHDRQVLDGLAAEFAPTVAQLGVSAAEFNARLAAEERRDAQLRQATERRFDSPQANQRAIDLSRRAIARVVDELAKRGSFDAAATEDRAMVTQSLAGGALRLRRSSRFGWAA